MYPEGLSQPAPEQVGLNGALEEGAAGTNVFEPNARTPFAGRTVRATVATELSAQYHGR